MKKAILLSVFALLVAVPATFAQHREYISFEVMNGDREANPHERQMMRMEEDRHPNIAAAMHSLEKALDDLNRAPENFGGHKADAMSDTRRALMSLRKALYFRIMEDRH